MSIETSLENLRTAIYEKIGQKNDEISEVNADKTTLSKSLRFYTDKTLFTTPTITEDEFGDISELTNYFCLRNDLLSTNIETGEVSICFYGFPYAEHYNFSNGVEYYLDLAKNSCFFFPKTLILSDFIMKTENLAVYADKETFSRGLCICEDCTENFVNNAFHINWVKNDAHIDQDEYEANFKSYVKINDGTKTNVYMYLHKICWSVDALCNIIDSLGTLSPDSISATQCIYFGEKNLNRIPTEYITKAEEKGWTLI